jgi:hypothetical protein
MSGAGESFSFLHLTDLHQGMASQAWLWPNVEEEFFRDLEKIHDASGPWDLVLFTGDLTQRGSSAEFAALDETLGRLYAHLASLGSAPVLLAVPGNHDLVRPDANDVPPEIEALLSWNERPRVVEQFWKRADSSYRKAIAAVFANYTAWWSAHPFPRPAEAHEGAMPGDFSASIRKGNLSLGIVGLNSTFLQLTADVGQGMLTVDPRQLDAACGRPGADWAREKNLCLLLTHHPPEWLTPGAQDALRAEIAPPRRFAAHLFGHMHEASTRTQAEGGAAPRRFWQGCSLFGLEYYGKDVERLHGYSAGRIEISSDTARFRLWPRLAQRHRAGHLHIVADNSFTLEDDDGTPPEPIQAFRPPAKSSSGAIPGLRDRRSTPRLEAVIPPERESSGGPRPPGGSYERPWHVERSSEEKARHCINGPGTPVILWAPADSGKTWILSHLLDSFNSAPDTRTIFIDMNGLGESHGESIEALLEPVTKQLFEALGGPPAGVTQPLRATSELEALMVNHILPSADRVIVTFDRADSVCDFKVQDDFFGMLRDWAQWSDKSVWSRLRLMVSVRQDPNRLSSSGSPFANVAQPIRFGDFKPNHLDELVQRYGLPWGQAEVAALMGEVGGHPYLTRQIMFDAAVESKSPGELLADVDLRRTYLNRYRGWLGRDSNLVRTLRTVRDANRDGTAAPRLNKAAIDKLLRFGIIVEGPDKAKVKYRLRCKLFEDLCE